MTAVDPLSDFLDGPRARGAFQLRVVMRPPWSMTVADEAPLTVMPLLAGSCWFDPADGSPIRLTAGDVLLVSGPRPYTLSTTPGQGPTIVIGAGQECSGVDGRDLSEAFATGPRTWGNDAYGSDRMIVGSYHSVGEVGRLLLRALPTHVVLTDPAPHLVPLLDAELAQGGPAQSAAFDRLLDLLLIQCVRVWADGDPSRQTWLAAGRDPVVAGALRLIHASPQTPWTLEGLAARCGLSRAAFARRFAEVTGSPAMTYLTTWRLARGADLLAEGLTLDAIADRVGYASGFSFSAAFKRAYGLSPAAYRRRVTAGSA